MKTAKFVENVYYFDADVKCGKCGNEVAINPNTGLCEDCEAPIMKLVKRGHEKPELEKKPKVTKKVKEEIVIPEPVIEQKPKATKKVKKVKEEIVIPEPVAEPEQKHVDRFNDALRVCKSGFDMKNVLDHFTVYTTVELHDTGDFKVNHFEVDEKENKLRWWFEENGKKYWCAIPNAHKWLKFVEVA